ncbi:hypothetical protein ECO9952_02039 [Escherichia coli O26:H11 str. CVM9952]|nr:hypothetical protein ECO9952_02039 [Escherichia coli O26:H11 str. CVM9952]
MWVSIVKDYVVPILSATATAGGIFMALMRKTFVPREAFEKLSDRVEKVETRLSSLPTEAEVNRLNVEIVTLRGELKTTNATLRSVSYQNELLLEQAVRKKRMSDFITEDQRLVILRSLADYNGELGESVLQDCLDDYGHRVSRDTVHTHIAWLAEQGLVRKRVLINGYFIAELTGRGQDVAEGRASVPGVKKPRARG